MAHILVAPQYSFREPPAKLQHDSSIKSLCKRVYSISQIANDEEKLGGQATVATVDATFVGEWSVEVVCVEPRTLEYQAKLLTNTLRLRSLSGSTFQEIQHHLMNDHDDKYKY